MKCAGVWKSLAHGLGSSRSIQRCTGSCRGTATIRKALRSRVRIRGDITIGHARFTISFARGIVGWHVSAIVNASRSMDILALGVWLSIRTNSSAKLVRVAGLGVSILCTATALLRHVVIARVLCDVLTPHLLLAVVTLITLVVAAAAVASTPATATATSSSILVVAVELAIVTCIVASLEARVKVAKVTVGHTSSIWIVIILPGLLIVPVIVATIEAIHAHIHVHAVHVHALCPKASIHHYVLHRHRVHAHAHACAMINKRARSKREGRLTHHRESAKGGVHPVLHHHHLHLHGVHVCAVETSAVRVIAGLFIVVLAILF